MSGFQFVRPIALLFAVLQPMDVIPGVAQSQMERTRLVRVGYVALDPSDPAPETSSSYQTVREHLTHIAADSERPGAGTRPLEFALSIGNDYQIFSWLREGAIDAAIVSPFSAFLLQREGVVIPLLELVGTDRRNGSRPILAASRPGGVGAEQPFQEFYAYLKRVLGEARSAGGPDAISGIREDHAVLMTTHLSTSGFIAPLLFADAWLQEELGKRPFPRGERAELEQNFWEIFFETVRFTLGSDGSLSLPPSASVVAFADLGHPDSALESLRARLGLGGWAIYPIDMDVHASASEMDLSTEPGRPHQELRRDFDRVGAAFRIPNDVLVLRSEVSGALFPIDESEPSSPAECGTRASDAWLLDRVRRSAAAIGPQGGYRGVQRYKAGLHAAFANRVARVIGPKARVPYMAEQHGHWFVDGHFEFRVEEVINFLRQDQVHVERDRLALVLPGGGVKSVYQAGLIEELYRRCLLVNGHGDAPRSCESPLQASDDASQDVNERTGPLHVESVIGTSGGAMVGLLTALHGPGEPLALATSVAQTASTGVFAVFDLLRWVSLLILLLMLVSFLLPLEPARDERVWRGRDRRRGGGGGAQRLSIGRRVFSAWPLVAYPLLVRVTGLGDLETVRGWEAGLYGMTIILVHLVLTSFRASERSAANVSDHHTILVRRQSSALGLLGFFLVGLALVGHYFVASPFLEHGLPLSVIATAGILCLYLGQILHAWAGDGAVQLVCVDEWLHGLAVAAAATSTAFALVLLGRAFGLAPILELTGRYWMALFLAGVLVFAPLAVWVSRPQRSRPLGRAGRWVRLRLLWLSETDGAGAWLNTPGNRLLALGAMGTVLWATTVVPGVYGNEPAIKAFRDAAVAAASVDGELHANLVVTGALLRDEVVAGGARVMQEGDVYFCFNGPIGCPTEEGQRWMVAEQSDWDMMVDAVFASGSPFPVFPAHRTRLPDGTAVSLVDGGFAHNVPFEAALLSGARQVLAIRSTPVELTDEVSLWTRGLRRVPSQLTLGLGRVFGFLFERAQELDRSRARGMFVASLAPAPREGKFPPLTSFTPKTVEWLNKQVRRDMEDDRRIGRVESWGEPTIVELVHG